MSPPPWLATYRANGIPAEIDADAHVSVVHMAEAAMTRFARKPAFRSFGQTLTYADIDRLSGAFAAWLQHRLGMRKGDRVAVMLPNMLAFPIATLGILRAGGVQVNVNPLYTPRELEHQLNDSGCEIIVVFNGSTPALADALERTGIKTVVNAALGDGSEAVLPSPSIDPRLTGSTTLADALREGITLHRTPVELRGDDLLLLQYTGGTTGLSKGASLTHRNVVANTEQFKAFASEALRPGQEVIVTAIPLYHIFALTINFFSYFAVGADNWLVTDPRDADAFIDVMAAARPSVFTGVNTLYAGLVIHPRIGEVDFSNLRLSAGGGSAIVSATSAKWKAITGHFIREGYGLSETAPLVSFNPTAIGAFSGTTGLPMAGTDIRLLDEEGVEVAPGQPGEVCVRGPQVMTGYWNQPEANVRAFTSDGYFRTGDIGVLDAAGFLRIVDRKKDMIIVSGFNVFPGEIEAIVSACPDVVECACVGLPHEKTGEAIHLFVVQTPGSCLTVEDIIAHCREEMTAYKVPKYVRIVDQLPKTTVGKILRRELRNLV
jgi:long-chain acyl-CoA synthetase